MEARAPFGLPRPEAEDALHRLRGLTLHATPTAELFEDALAIALDREISVYDASYVQLARARGVPLVTADEALVRKVGSAHDVQLLADATATE
ncbi:MAG TPA: type II toxin-antitoxin system VapC family toxin [Tepidisphaeraceae bacterium]|nr:type II toxin-antitoxin system VapC family toxin [Tepidisphaeraceae bacterium]